MHCFTSALPCLARRMVVAALLMIPLLSSAAEPLIALLDFELHELTPDSQLDTQRSRAASLSPMLVAELKEAHGLTIALSRINASPETTRFDNPVFNVPVAAGKLGRELSVDWLISCQLRKDNARFSYLRAQLIDVSRDHISADFLVEVRDNQTAGTRKGIVTLANQIIDTLKALKIVP